MHELSISQEVFFASVIGLIVYAMIMVGIGIAVDYAKRDRDKQMNRDEHEDNAV